MRRRLRLTLAYLGTYFAGWQRQRGVRTVQGAVEEALAQVFSQEIKVVGAGRTDAGVHADAQVAHCDPPFTIPPAGVVAALNARLPQDVRVLQVQWVSPAFHARRSARGKRYRYRLAWGPVLPPWEGLRRLWLAQAPNLDRLFEALALFGGTHDFRAFALSGHAGQGARGTVRRLFLVRLRRRRFRADIVLEGDGFLRGMARRLVGSALEVARGAQELDWLAGLLSGAEDGPPAPTAKAHGLTLEKVFYRVPQGWGVNL
ncbi:MAG: tRNA pseudouridine(38-40) synthase TruA [Thermoanaerobaculum sp.]|nr:tRNA pseudouridine(38-40) synthase TruA [Thermoanaerobaculum sp.]MDW7968142.1 tRNA pseudouridine(38-40) synthase TruA [Thermoanaerobaculum sp.]